MIELVTDKLNYNVPFALEGFDPCEGEVFFPVDGQNGILLVLQADGDTTVTVKGGDGVFGGKDLTIDLNGSMTIVQIESGPYVMTEGEYKNNIIVSGESFYAYALYLA